MLAFIGAFALFVFLCFKSIISLLAILSILFIALLYCIVKHIKVWLDEKDERNKEIELAEKRSEEIHKFLKMKFESRNMTDEDIEYLKEVLWKN